MAVMLFENAQHVGDLLAAIWAEPAPADHDPLANVGRGEPDLEPVAHAGHLLRGAAQVLSLTSMHGAVITYVTGGPPPSVTCLLRPAGRVGGSSLLVMIAISLGFAGLWVYGALRGRLLGAGVAMEELRRSVPGFTLGGAVYMAGTLAQFSFLSRQP